MIDERDCFWKQIENAYSKIYEEKYENELNNNGYKELTQLVFSAGIPRELLIPRLFFKNINEETYTNLPKCIQYFCSFKLRTPIFFYDLKLISSRQEVTKEQWILWDFACQIYPYMESKNKNNKCLLSDEFRASRSKLSGFWERTTKQCTFKYFSQTYPKEIYSLILLTWLDITHRKTTNEKYDKGKVEMYIFAQRLMIYLKETEATLKSKYPVKENDRGS
ncbi:MAG: hypothetical protein JXM79_24065 [Sedimentisphaerales bacterium]|nr:hypothetical protein [Sedimentisphaerales bacterium]